MTPPIRSGLFFTGIAVAAALGGVVAGRLIEKSPAAANNAFMDGYSTGYCVALAVGDAPHSVPPTELESLSQACLCVTRRLAERYPATSGLGAAPAPSDEELAQIREDCGMPSDPNASPA